MLMKVYLPDDMLPEGDVEIEDFCELVAKAQYIRDLRIAAIKEGVIEAFNEIYSD